MAAAKKANKKYPAWTESNNKDVVDVLNLWVESIEGCVFGVDREAPSSQAVRKALNSCRYSEQNDKAGRFDKSNFRAFSLRQRLQLILDI